MNLFKKKKTGVKSKAPVYYPIEVGQKVTLTIVGTWDGRQVFTPGHSYFQCGRGILQVDKDVWIEPYTGVEND